MAEAKVNQPVPSMQKHTLYYQLPGEHYGETYEGDAIDCKEMIATGAWGKTPPPPLPEKAAVKQQAKE